MKNSSYYRDGSDLGRITADNIIAVSDNGEYISWNDNIGGRGAWEGPLINAIHTSPNLTADDKAYLYYALGLNQPRSYDIKNEKGEVTGTVQETPLDHHKYIWE
jgi:hypothetical protein